jgi:flagellar protein FlgJ
MTPLAPIAPAGAPAPDDREARLQRAAHQLEGVFVQQLFKAMRETVPRDGIVNGGSGEEMFTSLMDEHLADRLPGQWHHGIGEALIRQLRRGLTESPPAVPPETP